MTAVSRKTRSGRFVEPRTFTIETTGMDPEVWPSYKLNLYAPNDPKKPLAAFFDSLKKAERAAADWVRNGKADYETFEPYDTTVRVVETAEDSRRRRWFKAWTSEQEA